MRKRQNRKQIIGLEEWLGLAAQLFPEMEIEGADARERVLDFCAELATAVDQAHAPRGNRSFLERGYGFMRWSVLNADDERLSGWIADWFFAAILNHSHSKNGCLEFLDWGDVERLGCFTTEPWIEDEGNYGRLCDEWRRRRSRNLKLPVAEIEIDGWWDVGAARDQPGG